MERLKYEELEPMSQEYYLKYMQAKAIEFNNALKKNGLEYGKEDTRRKQTGIQEWDYFLTCPCCGKELMIP